MDFWQNGNECAAGETGVVVVVNLCAHRTMVAMVSEQGKREKRGQRQETEQERILP